MKFRQEVMEVYIMFVLFVTDFFLILFRGHVPVRSDLIESTVLYLLNIRFYAYITVNMGQLSSSLLAVTHNSIIDTKNDDTISDSQHKKYLLDYFQKKIT